MNFQGLFLASIVGYTIWYRLILAYVLFYNISQNHMS